MRRNIPLPKVLLCMLLLIFLGSIPGTLNALHYQQNLSSIEFDRMSMADLFYKVQVGKKISVDLEDETIDQALKQISRETGLRLTYSGGIMEDKKITLKNESISVSDALADVLEGTGFEPRFSQDGYLLVVEAGEKLDALGNEIILQENIYGTVTDSESNESLPGVNIIVKGTSIGTTTNVDGNYDLSVSSLNDTLVISYVGYHTQEIPINGRSEIDVAMEFQVFGADELVVVGYGTQREVNLTGSISRVNFDEEMINRPITNASQAIGGRATGVWVSQNSGKPGSDGAQLRIRGWGTMSNANPLVIVDGIEGSLNQVNPNDIENISILKDAASAAIYGSKAANGVVLITTKKGRYEEQMKINVSSYTGVQSLGRRYNLVNDSAEMMELMNQAYINVGGSSRFPDYLISDFRNGDDPYKYPNTDFYDHLYRNTVMHEHNVSVRGGSEQTSVFLSLNYLDQEGIIQNTNTEKYGIRANVETKVSDRITLGGRLNYINQNSEEPYYPTASHGSMGRVYDIFETSAPFIAPYTVDGRFGSVQAIDKDGVIMYENNNPIIDANNGLASAGQNRLNVNAYTIIKLTNNLNWNVTAASSGNWNLTDRYNESVFGYTDTGVSNTSRNLNREGIEVVRGYNQRINNQFHTTLNYQKDFAQKHSVSVLGGAQLEDLTIKTLYARRSDPPKEGLTQIDAGTAGVVGEGNMNRLRMFSTFGRVNYAFLDKYLFEANIRADASSRFREGNRLGIFPGFSAGWRLIEEDFIQNLNVFSDLKIRGSWGQLGNQNVAGYSPYLPVINQTNTLSYSYGGSFNPGAAITQMVDENITWETTTAFDLGFEVGFYENKLKLTVDYFDKITEGILVSLPIPSTLGGISSPIENIGEMTNKGYEISLAYNNWAEPDQLGYSVELNMTHINNEVTRFRGGDSPDQLYLIREGYSFQTLYGYNAVGVYQTDNEAAEHMHSSGFTPIAGDLKYEDANSDGRMGFEDRQEMGNTLPRFTFGINPSLTFKSLNLSAVLQGAAGVNVWTQNQITMMNGDGATTISTRWRDAWTPENQDTDIPAIRIDYPWNNQQSSHWVEEISFIKVKNIQLGYSLPQNLTSRLGSNNIFIYANAQNVGTLVSDSYEGYDPERSTFDSGVRHYPVPRIISLGVNLEL